MLVLMRKKGESIVIGDDLKVCIKRLDDDGISLAIDSLKVVEEQVVVNRDVSQALVLFDEVTIHVLAINGRQVKLGINAPRSISVHREEIYKKILSEKSAA